MKVICVVGIRKSGKTTIVEELTKELARRGRRVGTVKTVFCPSFGIDDPKSNTARHARAGAVTVTARARHETAVIYKHALTRSQILSHYADVDYVLMEGDYHVRAPRIVAAHGEADARERINELTVAVSGRIADGIDALDGLPALSPLTQIGALCDLVEAHALEADAFDPDDPLPDPAASGDDFCQCGCHKNARKQDEVTVTVGGRTLTLTPEQEQTVRAWAGRA